MARLGINTGSIANDGTGDNLRAGAGKINDNFTELYSALGTGTTLQVGYGKTIVSLGSTTGYVGIGTTNATQSLDVVGNLRVTGVIKNASNIAFTVAFGS